MVALQVYAMVPFPVYVIQKSSTTVNLEKMLNAVQTVRLTIQNTLVLVQIGSLKRNSLLSKLLKSFLMVVNLLNPEPYLSKYLTHIYSSNNQNL